MDANSQWNRENDATAPVEVSVSSWWRRRKMMNCNVCGKKAYIDGNAECPSCARLRGYDDIELKRLIVRLRTALLDAINLPMGHEPVTAEDLLDE